MQVMASKQNCAMVNRPWYSPLTSSPYTVRSTIVEYRRRFSAISIQNSTLLE